MIGRRGFLFGLAVAPIAAPAMVREAAKESGKWCKWGVWNAFKRTASPLPLSEFATDGAKIGTTIRIRLPNDYQFDESISRALVEANKHLLTDS